MKKLDVPPYASTELYDISVEGLADEKLRKKFEKNREEVVYAFQQFDINSQTKTWCKLKRAAHGRQDAIVAGSLSKAELVALYDDGVVKSRGEPRKIYDKIRVSARDECPYCGGVGEMGKEGELGTTDHFLPKAYFPTYSVLPTNLVPSCQTCNSGMGANFPTDENSQPLHPYLDESHFFDTKWLYATVCPDEPLVVNYWVKAPKTWSDKDRARVDAHFKACRLASRYRSRVWTEIAPLISQRKSSLHILSPDQFRDHLLVTANEPKLPINGWKRVLYSALASSSWFCNEKF